MVLGVLLDLLGFSHLHVFLDFLSFCLFLVPFGRGISVRLRLLLDICGRWRLFCSGRLEDLCLLRLVELQSLRDLSKAFL